MTQDTTATVIDGVLHAWWSGSLYDLRLETDEHILGQLCYRAIRTHEVNRDQQIRAWQRELEVLREALADLPGHWRVLLEYPLLRLGRRLDVIFLTDRAIFALEFKAYAQTFNSGDRRQVEDYALDLRDFHSGSRNQAIVPILIATEGLPSASTWALPLNDVYPVYEASASSLKSLLQTLLRQIKHGEIDVNGWESAAYKPVPTIIEAATRLYARHGVADIAAARADTGNLTRTTNALLQAISDAQKHRKHIIVFVTGIPGAGKTLCGLNAVFQAGTDAAFLTGTLPMIFVLREALARDAAETGTKSMRQAHHETESKVQSLTGFMREYTTKNDAPHEHVLVFDEAQRAWDAAYGRRKFMLDNSEAALFLDILSRHKDYAVAIALVGNGQEINTGEAGLAEWGKALSARPNWAVRTAPGTLTAKEPKQRLFAAHIPEVTVDLALHLDVPVRSVNSLNGAAWVDAVLRGEQQEARDLVKSGVNFFVTRSLEFMRKELRERARGQRRSGLVCSTGARRLVADGIWPEFPHLDEQAVANWFLNNWPDVRASDALEVPATQFACQGLELDFVGLCWGGDLVWTDGWVVRSFRGSKWQLRQSEEARSFCLNSYRVLLTRARYDTIIWVPEGDPNDKTREPALFNKTVAYLTACGATNLNSL